MINMNPNSNSVLIQGGRVIDPANNRDEIADVFIRDGKIEAIDPPGKIHIPPSIRTINARNRLVCPGFVDIHTHLREPGGEHKETIETGTLAAAAGGFTSIACMANTTPVNDNAFVTSYLLEKIKSSAKIKVYPIGAITKGLQGEDMAEIGKMVDAGIKAISDDGRCVMNAYLMRKALHYSTVFDIPVLVHAEDENLVGKGVINEGAMSTILGLRGIPACAEEIIVARDITLCEHTGARLHICHISSAKSVELVKRAKEKGLKVTCEVTPHHLHLTEENIIGYDTHCKCRPPLRTQKDVDALRVALAEGVIDCIATDHAPHSSEEKEVVFENASNGIVGLESAFSLGFDLVEKGILTLNDLISRMTHQGAEILKIPAGTLSKGSSGDVVIIDPEESYTFTRENLLGKSKNSPFIERKMKGRVKQTILDGKTVFIPYEK